jgi:hypothetical protein
MAVDDTTTLLVAIRELARDIEGDVPAGTATAGAANQITDTNNTSPLRSDIIGLDFWVPRWVYIHTGTANGDERKISASSGTGGTIDSERGFSATPTTSSQYHIYPFSRTVLVQAINDSLSRCFHEDWILLTDVIDGDMRRLHADIATYWTASGSNTISKVTTVADRVVGPQALRNQNTAGNEYVKQTSRIPVYQNRGYRVEAVGRIAVGTADLIVYDETNGKEIDSLSTIEISPDPGLRPFRLVIEFNTDTAEEITLRLGGVESSADVAWNYLALRDKHAKEFQLDRVIETPDDVSAIRWRKFGPHSGHSERSFWHRVERTGGPGGVLTVRVDHANYEGTGWAVCRQPYIDLSADSDTTYCPQDWFVSGAAVELLRPLRGVDNEYERRYQRVLARHKRESKRHQVHLPNYPTMEEVF